MNTIRVMKTFHSILPSFALGFDFICIVLAGIYTFQQLYTYVKNEDVSEISFQKFTDDSSSRNYPTYTICFEDQEQHHIYNTETILTFAFDQMAFTKFNPKRCPCGCHVQREGNRLRLLKQECPEHSEDIHESYLQNLPDLYDENGNPNPYYSQDHTSGGDHSSYDPGFPSIHDNAHFDSSASGDSILASGNIAFPQYDHFQNIQSGGGSYFNQSENTTYDYGILPYDPAFPSYDPAISLNNDSNSNTSDASFYPLPSHDNTFPTYDSNFPMSDDTSNNNDYMSLDEFLANENMTSDMPGETSNKNDYISCEKLLKGVDQKVVTDEADFDLNWGENMNGNEMIVYDKYECNVELIEKLNENRECKLYNHA